jgi:hypothetical protein
VRVVLSSWRCRGTVERAFDPATDGAMVAAPVSAPVRRLGAERRNPAPEVVVAVAPALAVGGRGPPPVVPLPQPAVGAFLLSHGDVHVRAVPNV